MLSSVCAAWDWVVKMISDEWLLKGQANGGDIIVARAIFAAATLFFIYIGLKQSLDPSRQFAFDFEALLTEAHSSLPVFGALLAAVYASLYTRFAAQWNYLAGLHNQILKAEIDFAGVAPNAEKQQALADWKASFIEDAIELHLSCKRIFVPAIEGWLSECAVQEAFVDGALGGSTALSTLEANLKRARSRAASSPPPEECIAPSAATPRTGSSPRVRDARLTHPIS